MHMQKHSHDRLSKAFPDLMEKAQEVIRDQFIEGLCDEHVQEHLFQEVPETMENSLKFAHQLGATRAAQTSLKSLQATTTVSSISEGADLQQAVRRSVQEARMSSKGQVCVLNLLIPCNAHSCGLYCDSVHGSS